MSSLVNYVWPRHFGYMHRPLVHWHYGKSKIEETEEEFKLKIPFPGFSFEEISINLEGNELTIKAEHETEEGEEEEQTYPTHYLDRKQDVKQYRLPTGIKAQDIEASYKNGVLSLSIKKSEPESIPIIIHELEE